jgi:uncharacterized protein (TIGR03084 family)
MAIDRAVVLADLAAESEDLDRMVAGLPDEGWATPTPAEGWTIAHQIAHLTWTDARAVTAATDGAAFLAELTSVADPLSFVDVGAAEGAAQPPAGVLAAWRTGRAQVQEALMAVPADARLPWYGPPMVPASMATARIMETWAHARDVADALGVVPAPTGRLRHVAHLGVRTRDFAYMVRDLPAPAEAFRVELTGPDGDVWTWGPAEAAQRVSGPALHFCLLVTQRRHRADLALTAVGLDADRWLEIAQSFAGPPGGGRKPGQFG